MSRDYIPASDAARILWLTNLREKIAIHGPYLGMSTTQISVIQNLCTAAINKINAVNAVRAELNAALTAKNGINTGELAQIRTEAARWKTHPQYTPELGEMLGIVGGSTTLDSDTYQAYLSGAVVGNVVRLKFKKLGADGVNIYYRRKGSVEWVFLARDTQSPYDHHIKLAVPGTPEHWEYRAFGVKYDVEIGLPSDIVEVVFGG